MKQPSILKQKLIKKRKKAKNVGMVGFVPKPFKEQDIVEIIKNLAKNRI